MRPLRTLPLLALTTILLLACGEPPKPSINLYRAIHAGDLDQIKRHLYWGTDVNQADPDGDYPLHVAARRGRVVIAEELLDHGADPNAENLAGKTPLRVALEEGKTQVAAVLVEEGAAEDPQALLFELARAGVTDRDSLKFLLSQGADIDARDEAGDAALHIAIRDSRLLLVKRLIDQGADVNLADGEGRTPLELAGITRNRDITLELERYGARAAPAAEQTIRED
jgi:ankyrin repeat protein